MHKLIEDFRCNKTKYFRKRHSNTESWERQRNAHVERFLSFCSTKYRLWRIDQIGQKHYQTYVRHLIGEGQSSNYIRQQSIALKDFAAGAHLPLQINPTRAHQRRVRKIEKGITAD